MQDNESIPEVPEFDLDHIIAVPINDTDLPARIEAGERVPVVVFRATRENGTLVAVPPGVVLLDETGQAAAYVGDDNRLSVFSRDEQGAISHIPQIVQDRVAGQQRRTTAPAAPNEPEDTGSSYHYINDYELANLVRREDRQAFEELLAINPERAAAWILQRAGQIGAQRRSLHASAQASRVSAHLADLTLARRLHGNR